MALPINPTTPVPAPEVGVDGYTNSAVQIADYTALASDKAIPFNVQAGSQILHLMSPQAVSASIAYNANTDTGGSSIKTLLNTATVAAFGTGYTVTSVGVTNSVFTTGVQVATITLGGSFAAPWPVLTVQSSLTGGETITVTNPSAGVYVLTTNQNTGGGTFTITLTGGVNTPGQVIVTYDHNFNMNTHTWTVTPYVTSSDFIDGQPSCQLSTAGSYAMFMCNGVAGSTAWYHLNGYNTNVSAGIAGNQILPIPFAPTSPLNIRRSLAGSDLGQLTDQYFGYSGTASNNTNYYLQQGSAYQFGQKLFIKNEATGTNQLQITPAVAGTQIVRMTGTPTGGSYTLTIPASTGPNATPAIPPVTIAFNANTTSGGSSIQTLLQAAITTAVGANYTVTVSPSAQIFNNTSGSVSAIAVSFGGYYTGQTMGPMAVQYGTLTGGTSPTVSVIQYTVTDSIVGPAYPTTAIAYNANTDTGGSSIKTLLQTAITAVYGSLYTVKSVTTTNTAFTTGVTTATITLGGYFAGLPVWPVLAINGASLTGGETISVNPVGGGVYTLTASQNTGGGTFIITISAPIPEPVNLNAPWAGYRLFCTGQNGPNAFLSW